MPWKNSRFRIIHRHPDDPHGEAGYFIHEIYIQVDRMVTGWRAGVSLGHMEIAGLEQHLIRVIEAFNHAPIKYQDLSRPGFQLPTEDGIEVPVKHVLLKQRKSLPEAGIQPKIHSGG